MLNKLKIIDLPTVGIFAFSLASTWALFQFFNSSATHPTLLYWIPAALVEIVTAWLMMHVTQAVYQVTRSNLPKQDRRFYRIVAMVAAVLSIPTLAASIQANLYEFSGAWWLALLFPAAAIGCAIGAQIPRSIARHRSERNDEHRQELKKLRGQLSDARTELKEARAELRMSRATIEQLRTDANAPRTMDDATREIYAQLCASLNGDTPKSVRDAAKLLNDAGYYAPADSTLRSWM